MTRAQFLARRAVMHFERTHGVTVVPAVAVVESPDVVQGRRHTLLKAKWSRLAHPMGHFHEDDDHSAGAAVRSAYHRHGRREKDGGDDGPT